MKKKLKSSRTPGVSATWSPLLPTWPAAADIKLGEGVADLGGLMIIGTERHESRRIDNQLRGRAARPGRPGDDAVLPVPGRRLDAYLRLGKHFPLHG